MKTISRFFTMALGAGMFGALFVSNAVAGCGDFNIQAPFQFVSTDTMLRQSARLAQARNAAAARRNSGDSEPSIVGLWKVQLISKGNTNHNPVIPDNVLIDFGYTQWHDDGTEILNSGGHSASTGNFCLGVWGKTGYLNYELNHFPISYDAATGAIAAFINLRELDTLSPSGDSYTGTFTLDVYDPSGNHVDHLAGDVLGERLTVDSKLPASIPNQPMD